ncbi:DUF6882 domain-containing protein [Corynebacterium sp. H128]|uniref:DUF6882 domain-containing protein n=1 Tax=Corynebacterium sp. H128 TaxID=3133427 RepID=UPI0030A6A0A2
MNHLESPTSLADIAVDGAVKQALIDAQFSALLGPVTATEVAQVSELGFEVRYAASGRSDMTFPALKVAELAADGWLWTSPRMQAAAEAFGIPELWGQQPAEHPSFVRAARTLHDGAPVQRAPLPDGREVILALEPQLPAVPPADAFLFAAGLPATTAARAITAYAVTSHADVSSLLLDMEIPYDLLGGMLLDDIRADAAYLSIENQLLFDALVPHQPGNLHFPNNTAEFTTPRGPLTATASVVATVTGGTWTWAWADTRLPLSALGAANNVRAFGFANRIPALCTASLPVERAQAWGLESVVKPILGVWTHSFIPLTADTYAVALISHPAVQLPPPTPEAVRAVLDTTLPARIAKERALAAYAHARGLGRSGDNLTVAGTPVASA